MLTQEARRQMLAYLQRDAANRAQNPRPVPQLGDFGPRLGQVKVRKRRRKAGKGAKR